LHSYLQERLPDYMLPVHYVHMDRLPLTSNGKVDRKALPDPESTASVDYVAPSNGIEEQLVGIWSDVLKLDRGSIGVTRSFFELGGHSLNATVLTSKILNHFKVEVPLVNIFIRPTIKSIASEIASLTQMIDLGRNRLVVQISGISTNNNMFMVHDGSGDIQAYTQLASGLKGYNCWGLRSDSISFFGPVNMVIRDLAASHLRKIKSIQPNGPYTILGWSIGGILAYEIARQIESTGDVVDKLFMLDSQIDYSKELKTTSFSLNSEKKILRGLVKATNLTFDHANSVEELWAESLDILYKQKTEIIKNFIPSYLQSIIPNFNQIDLKFLIIYTNTIRTLNRAIFKYNLKGKLETQLIYLKAAKSNADSNGFQRYFKQKITSLVVDGDHFSMLKNPVVKALVERIDEHQEVNN
ncbi:thioesterase domain-containing protein, partial [Maribacter sp. 2307UL18-2]|uniref:thioesterase domain-containing protein n=1 Tax=Maribacter sp. 2307UL18-2 TaxID=3386274 RepID=UPI0039BCD35B